MGLRGPGTALEAVVFETVRSAPAAACSWPGRFTSATSQRRVLARRSRPADLPLRRRDRADLRDANQRPRSLLTRVGTQSPLQAPAVQPATSGERTEKSNSSSPRRRPARSTRCPRTRSARRRWAGGCRSGRQPSRRCRDPGALRTDGISPASLLLMRGGSLCDSTGASPRTTTSGGQWRLGRRPRTPKRTMRQARSCGRARATTRP